MIYLFRLFSILACAYKLLLVYGQDDQGCIAIGGCPEDHAKKYLILPTYDERGDVATMMKESLGDLTEAWGRTPRGLDHDLLSEESRALSLL
jgi:hypothetical protein